jgi:molybdenum cofactor synthesis domain-containing protein
VLCINAEIITFGRELLIGHTINTNGAWIAKQLTSLGIIVTRITVAGDTINEISQAVAESVARNPSLIITTGGLGSTYDDLTFDGLASALSIPKETNAEALDQVKARYRSLKLEMSPWRKKMAVMPSGAKPMTNRLGSAPGMFLEHKGIMIFSLPGVPKEMMGMFTDQVIRIIKARTPPQTFREKAFIIEGVPESSLAPIIEKWLGTSKNVYLKSHPSGSEGKPTITIHLSAMGPDAGALDEAILNAESTFSKLVESAGGKIRREKS